MVEISYAYEIVFVDKVHKVMEVIYKSPQYGETKVAVHLPAKGEYLDVVLKHYAPIIEWTNRGRPYLDVKEGQTGEFVGIVERPWWE